MPTVVAKPLGRVEREQFLELVRAGRNRAEAADEIGWTGTKMRQLLGRDDALRADYETARSEGRRSFADELLSEVRRRLLVERTGSDRLLAMTLETYDEDWAARAAARRSERSNGDEASFELGRPMIDVSLLTDGQLEELDEHLRAASELIAIGQGRAPNTELQALTVGSTAD